MGRQWGHPKIQSGGGTFQKSPKVGGTRLSASPLPGLKYTPEGGDDFGCKIFTPVSIESDDLLVLAFLMNIHYLLSYSKLDTMAENV